MWGRGGRRGEVVVVGIGRDPTCVCMHHHVISQISCRMLTKEGPTLSRLGHRWVLYRAVSLIRVLLTRIASAYTTPPLGVSLPTFRVLLQILPALSLLRLSNNSVCLLFLYSRTRRAHILHLACCTRLALASSSRTFRLQLWAHHILNVLECNYHRRYRKLSKNRQ